jgi:hypothetical protein
MGLMLPYPGAVKRRDEGVTKADGGAAVHVFVTMFGSCSFNCIREKPLAVGGGALP